MSCHLYVVDIFSLTYNFGVDHNKIDQFVISYRLGQQMM